MSTVFVDRESAYPNRYRVAPDNGNAFYAVLERADEPVTPGTPLNAETFNGMRNEIDGERLAHINDKNNPHGVTAAQVGAADITHDAEGNVITLTNSGDASLLGLKLFGKTTQFTTIGKNLLPTIDEPLNASGITWTIRDDGGVKVSGTATATTWFLTSIPYEDSRRATLNPGTYFLSGVKNGSGVAMYVVANSSDGSSTTTSPKDTGNGALYVIEKECQAYIQMVVTSGTTVNTVVYPQFELGSAATAYEPYTGGKASPSPDYPQELETVGASGAINTTAAGAQLIPYSYEDRTSTSSGITFKDQGDNSYIVTGTATAVASRILGTLVLPAGTYILSGSSYPVLVQINKKFANGAESFIAKSDNGASATFTLSENTSVILYALVTTGAAISSGVVIKPMLNMGSTALPFEAYKGKTLTASTPNGLPGIPVSSGGNYTDENGQQWICDEKDYARGVYVQRVYDYCITGNETVWRTDFNLGCYTMYDFDLQYMQKATVSVGLCTHFEYKPSSGVAPWFRVYKDAIDFNLDGTNTDLEGFKTWLSEQYAGGSPVTVRLALATPIETPLPAEELAQYAALHTNYPNTTVFNDSGAYMEIRYGTPNTAVPMNLGSGRAGDLLAVDEHGCVVTSPKSSMPFAPVKTAARGDLSSVGWYRVGMVKTYNCYRLAVSTIYNQEPDMGAIIDIVTPISAPLLHKTVASFSRDTVKAIDQIRLVKNADKKEEHYVDIHYSLASANRVSVLLDGPDGWFTLYPYAEWVANPTGTAAVTLAL